MRTFLILLSMLFFSTADAQTTRRIQSSDVTGALGYTPIQSIQGMTGILTCGTGLICNAQTLSVGNFPVSSLTGLGTGVATALSFNIGSPNAVLTSLTGDVTTVANAATLATVNANVGSFGSATNCVSFTTNAKGLITAVSSILCTPAISSITGLGTGVAAALGVNIGSAGAPVLFNGAGGTPSSMVGTNITGTAAGLTAGTANAFTAGSASNLNSGTLPPARTNGHMNGTATNDNAAAGEVGEYLENVLSSGSATSFTTATPKNIAQITLTAGDWDVSGMVNGLVTNASTSLTGYAGSLSTTTNTLDTSPGKFSQVLTGAFVPGNSATVGVPLPPMRFSVTGSTTVYLVGYFNFTVSTMSGYGIIRARRAR